MKQSKRKLALARLTQQLTSGVKTKKGTRDEKIPLTKIDIQRIEREMATLNKHLK